jgi:hypothetical protein
MIYNMIFNGLLKGLSETKRGYVTFKIFGDKAVKMKIQREIIKIFIEQI